MKSVLESLLGLDRTTQRGQAYTEYGLILFLVGITVIGALMLLGQQVFALWHQISASMPR